MIFNCFCPSSIFSLLQHLRPGLTDDNVPDRCSRFRDRDHLAIWLTVMFTGSITYCTIYFTEMQNAARFPTFSLKPEWLPTVGGFQRTVATFPDWGTITMTWDYSTWMVRNWQGCREFKIVNWNNSYVWTKELSVLQSIYLNVDAEVWRRVRGGCDWSWKYKQVVKVHMEGIRMWRVPSHSFFLFKCFSFIVT